jgi:hypothetical protein
MSAAERATAINAGSARSVSAEHTSIADQVARVEAGMRFRRRFLHDVEATSTRQACIRHRSALTCATLAADAAAEIHPRR